MKTAFSWTSICMLLAASLLAACADGMTISGKTPVLGTIRLAPTAACPIPSSAPTTVPPAGTQAAKK